MASLVERIYRESKSRGLWGSSGTWLGVWVLIGGVRLARRLTADKPVVVTERLEPGQQLLISHLTDRIVASRSDS